MKVLFIAPQPYFQERGTTIAIDLLLKVLSERGDEVDVLTLHVGEDRNFEHVTIHRIEPKPAPRAVKPGFSLQKVWCDLFLMRHARRMMKQTRYDLVYAVEEAGFIARILHRSFGVPYVVDMDSSMTTQLVDKFGWLGWARGMLDRMEGWPLKKAVAVIPMCDDLADVARNYSGGYISVLRDVSLVAGADAADAEDLRKRYGIEAPILLYVGNLEEYQGIDLLLDCMHCLKDSGTEAVAVIIGGAEKDIDKYRDKAAAMDLGDRVVLTGPRPVAALGAYLAQGTILMSPRVHGTNTPMKIYSYLDAGVPVVATALPTHTQVMSDNEAALVATDGGEMARVVQKLLAKPDERKRLADNARALVARNHSMASFRNAANTIFDEIAGRIGA